MNINSPKSPIPSSRGVDSNLNKIQSISDNIEKGNNNSVAKTNIRQHKTKKIGKDTTAIDFFRKFFIFFKILL